MFKMMLNPLNAPETLQGSGAALEDKALGKEDIYDLLKGEDLDPPSPSKDDDKKVDTKPKDDGLDDSEDEGDEEGTELDLKPKDDEGDEDLSEEELEFKDVPSHKEVLKKYPELFKDFPALKAQFFREQQYSELFPTIQEARESKEKADNYEQFEETLLNGNIEGVLSSVKQADPKAFDKISEHFLGTLNKIDRTAYLGVIANVTKDLAVQMFIQGKRSNNENLQLAAQYLHGFIFNDTQITPYQFRNELETKANPKEEELNQREVQINRDLIERHSTDVSDRVENLIKRSVDNHIDPNNKMTPYVRDKAVKDILEAVEEEIKGDARFSKVLDNLWINSARNNYSSNSKQKIRDALLGKAKSILPGIIRRVKAEALRGSALRAKNDRDDESPLPRGRVANESTSKSGSERRENNTNKSGKSEKGMSTLEFFNRNG